MTQGDASAAGGEVELSALVVAHDEEANLPDCLERLRFADEIVVLLDRCTDGSRAIAERFGARILEGAWPLEGERRNTGIAACRGRWILEIVCASYSSASRDGEWTPVPSGCDRLATPLELWRRDIGRAAP